MLKTGEAFDKYIPKQVNILPVPQYYEYLYNKDLNITVLKKIKFTLCRYKSSVQLRLNGKVNVLKNNQQIFYENQKNLLDNVEGEYDVAIAYAQGFPTYFIADKVKAKTKLAWINCDYTHTAYDKNIDKIYYDKVDKIIAVSESGRKSIINVNLEYEKKIEIIKDIVDPKLIEKMSNEEIVELNNNEFNIVTVARLVKGYKGYDLAVSVEKLLKDNGYKFKWYVIGDGEDRDEIEELIRKNKIEDRFILLGSRDNPYPYMKECDIYVQPSRVEGFGLTVIEAKILKKLIVCTNFSAAKELIEDNVDGKIVEINVDSIYEGIKEYIENEEFKNKILTNLIQKEAYTSISEIEKLYGIIEE